MTTSFTEVCIIKLQTQAAVIIDISRFGQLLVVAHTDRGEKIRIISARKAT